jgi:hypothetical protein
MDDLVESARAVLALTPGRWQALAAGIPAGLLARPPAAGEWSALDCLRHLLDAEREVFPVRVRALLAGQDFPGFDPDAQGTAGADGGEGSAELAATFAGMRAASLAALARVGADDLARTARHAELGPVTLEQLLHEWAAHDLMHTVQAERALMQPFIAGSGPWRFYFADHDVGAAGGDAGRDA